MFFSKVFSLLVQTVLISNIMEVSAIRGTVIVGRGGGGARSSRPAGANGNSGKVNSNQNAGAPAGVNQGTSDSFGGVASGNQGSADAFGGVASGNQGPADSFAGIASVNQPAAGVGGAVPPPDGIQILRPGGSDDSSIQGAINFEFPPPYSIIGPPPPYHVHADPNIISKFNEPPPPYNSINNERRNPQRPVQPAQPPPPPNIQSNNRPPKSQSTNQRTLSNTVNGVIGANKIKNYNATSVTVTTTTQKTPEFPPVSQIGNGIVGNVIGSAIYDFFGSIFKRVSSDESMAKSSNMTQKRAENGSDVVKISIYLLIIVCLRIYCHLLNENIL